MPPAPLTRLRKLCLALPEAHEAEAWEAPTFRVRNKMFAMFVAAGTHHVEGRPSVWIKAAADNQRLMVRDAPDRFFVPPYMGPSGWIGVFLDGRDAPVDWKELAQLLEDGYRMIAPKRLLATLDGPPTPPAKRRAR